MSIKVEWYVESASVLIGNLTKQNISCYSLTYNGTIIFSDFHSAVQTYFGSAISSETLLSPVIISFTDPLVRSLKIPSPVCKVTL